MLVVIIETEIYVGVFLASLPSLPIRFSLAPGLLLTVRTYLNTQKYRLFCSLVHCIICIQFRINPKWSNR